jgi:hypothetical protein
MNNFTFTSSNYAAALRETNSVIMLLMGYDKEFWLSKLVTVILMITMITMLEMLGDETREGLLIVMSSNFYDR